MNQIYILAIKHSMSDLETIVASNFLTSYLKNTQIASLNQLTTQKPGITITKVTGSNTKPQAPSTVYLEQRCEAVGAWQWWKHPHITSTLYAPRCPLLPQVTLTRHSHSRHFNHLIVYLSILVTCHMDQKSV